MAQNKSLSTQEVAEMLHVSKSTIYELIRKGEINSYKIGRKVRFTQEDVDAYISRSRHEHSTRPVQIIDTHSTLLTPENSSSTEIIISGQDVILDILTNYLQRDQVHAARTYLSGFEGLLSLYQDHVDVAACHLFDGDGYNASYVKSLVPGANVALINLSYRKLGFYVRRGNPKKITGWKDLRRKDIQILNRRVGSSSRIALDIQLKKMGLSGSSIPGYHHIMKSHLTMAAAVAEGEADLALGTERITRQTEEIEFIPLMDERYDLAVKQEKLETRPVQKMVQILNSPEFKKEIWMFSGNDYRSCGRIIEEI